MQTRTLALTCFFLLGFLLTIFIVSYETSQALSKTKEVKVLGEKTEILLTDIVTPTPTQIPTPTLTPTPTSIPAPTLIPTQTPTPTVIPAPLSLDDLFTKYSNQYGVAKDLLQKIANCESSFNSNASSGDYKGMFQFASHSWITNRNNMGLDNNTDLRQNAEESIKTAAFMISENKTNSWPTCSR